MKTIIESTDYHTAGEPFRIIDAPPVALPGATVAARRAHAMTDPDVEQLRKVLCYEPRGHADMYGGFITPPDDEGADFGVLFWHKDGFSTACGHGTIALGVWALQTGRVQADPSGTTDVKIDVPSGRVTARVHAEGDKITSVDFINVPSYVIAKDIPVETSYGTVTVDITFGGAAYAQLNCDSIGLTVEPKNITELISIGRAIKWKLNESEHSKHPTDSRLDGIYGTIIYEELPADEAGTVRQRNVTVFADGEVDRSPCGSGTASRVATLTARGILGDGKTLVHESIVGTLFRAQVLEQVEIHGGNGVIVQVSGMAYRTGQHKFEVDPDDILVPGFVLR